MCEDNTGETFQMLVTNAVQCNAPDASGTTAQGWDLTYENNSVAVDPDVTVGGASDATNLFGTGNQTYTFDVNDALPVISATVNDHYFIITNKENTTGISCASSIRDTFRLRVEPRPVAHFATSVVEVCEGQSSSISVNVSNAVLRTAGVNWEIEFTEESALLSNNCTPSSGANSNLISSTGRFTGNGDGNTIFTVPATLAPGVYTFTLDRITNTAGPCEGFIIENGSDSFERIVVIVHPRMDVSLTPIVDTICQVGQPTFDLQVFNATTCNELNDEVNRDWEISYTDNVLSDAIAVVGGASTATELFGTGNQTYTLQANSTSAITAGTHIFDITSIESLSGGGFTAGCDSVFSPSKTYTLTVNPEPTAEWSHSPASPLEICENTTGSFTLTIANAEVDYGAGLVDVDWQVTFTERSGNIPSACNDNSGAEGDFPGLDTGALTGTGNGVLTFNVPATLAPGQYTFIISSVLNTTHSCTGEVIGNDTIVINVRPQPIAQVLTDTGRVCQGDDFDFDIAITNARYCPSVNNASVGAQWSLAFTDATESDAVSNPLVNSDNATVTINANSLTPPGLPAGYYDFRLTTIQNTTPSAGCVSSVPVTDDSLFVLVVNPRPTVDFSTTSLNLCEGAGGSFNFRVQNAELAGVPVAWSVTLTESSGSVTSSL
jgi:hypothetical protein